MSDDDQRQAPLLLPTVVRTQMTFGGDVDTVLRVRNESGRTAARKPRDWPFQRFARDLDAWMAAQDIPDITNLARLAGMAPSTVWNWTQGHSRPTRATLRKIAEVLEVDVRELEVSAGLSSPAEVGLTQYEPADPVDSELSKLESHWRDASPELRQQIIEKVRWVNDWIEMAQQISKG